MPGRLFSPAGYRYGFGGQEMDDDIKGTGNSLTAEYWEYDSRLGRRWNIDPVVKAYESPYATFSNNPIYFDDPNGDEPDAPTGNGGSADGAGGSSNNGSGGLNNSGNYWKSKDGSGKGTPANPFKEKEVEITASRNKKSDSGSGQPTTSKPIPPPVTPREPISSIGNQVPSGEIVRLNYNIRQQMKSPTGFERDENIKFEGKATLGGDKSPVKVGVNTDGKGSITGSKGKGELEYSHNGSNNDADVKSNTDGVGGSWDGVSILGYEVKTEVYTPPTTTYIIGGGQDCWACNRVTIPNYMPVIRTTTSAQILIFTATIRNTVAGDRTIHEETTGINVSVGFDTKVGSISIGGAANYKYDTIK